MKKYGIGKGVERSLYAVLFCVFRMQSSYYDIYTQKSFIL